MPVIAALVIGFLLYRSGAFATAPVQQIRHAPQGSPPPPGAHGIQTDGHGVLTPPVTSTSAPSSDPLKEAGEVIAIGSTAVKVGGAVLGAVGLGVTGATGAAVAVPAATAGAASVAAATGGTAASGAAAVGGGSAAASTGMAVASVAVPAAIAIGGLAIGYVCLTAPSEAQRRYAAEQQAATDAANALAASAKENAAIQAAQGVTAYQAAQIQIAAAPVPPTPSDYVDPPRNVRER